MKFILLLLLPSCIIGQVIRLQFPVITFQPLKFTFPTIRHTTSISSNSGSSTRAATTSTTSGTAAVTSFRSSSSGEQQPTTFTTRNDERQTSMFMASVRNSMNAANGVQQPTAASTRNNEATGTSVLTSTNRNTNSQNVASTRSSVNEPQPQASVSPVSVVRQNALPASSAPATSTSTSNSQTQQLTPGNVARQIKLLMSRGRSGISARTSSISSSNGPSCATPDGENGVCTHVSDCNLFLPYMDLLDQPAVQIFFIERVCRITNMEMHVCCPASPFAQGPTLRSSSSVVPRESECGFPTTNRLVNGEQVSNFFGGGC